MLAPKSNPLLAVEELHFTKQGSMTSGEFHSHIVKIAKRCQFPNAEAEERAIGDAIFLGMNSQRARDEAINLMNEEGKEISGINWQLKIAMLTTRACPSSIPPHP